MLKDPDLDNFERLYEYKGIICAMDKEGDPDLHPFNLDPHKPVEEQVNWDWIESLEAAPGKGR